MRFFIMNGAGNRFGVFDARSNPDFHMHEALAQKTAAQNGPMGALGADQIIVMRAPKSGGDVFMEIWNADGAQVDACGNASRCIPWLVMNETGKDNIVLETNVGHLLTKRISEFQVCVDMGKPKLEWNEIPLKEYMDTRVIDVKIGPIDNPVLSRPGAVNMGNPHCVFFVDNADEIAADKIGPMIEFHPLFPEQCNVGFAQIVSRTDIRLRVWERGTGLTQACGTGACAALVAAERQGRTEREANVKMDGGTLHIHWRKSDDHVIKTGPVELEFKGELPD
ncbi:MAG TPA: diaminopimelate epimerase [Hellea balneolensis]|uniref:Diaminopimelate epimerase n=1 Tax=Hellea balneolensis TaxID=287478 RepID=A0A7C3FZJ3_9PROT|nr:diaminopimelate epimerase [Hellea balneolensis]